MPRVLPASSDQSGTGVPDHTLSHRPWRRLASIRQKFRASASMAPMTYSAMPTSCPEALARPRRGPEPPAIHAAEPGAGPLHQPQVRGRGGHLAREGHAHQHVHVAKPREHLLLAALHDLARNPHPGAHPVRDLSREDAGEGDLHISTICVCVVSESSRPDSSVTRVCHTWVRLPLWSGVASARTTPLRPAAKKLVLDSSVVVDAPAGRLTTVAAAPTVSASAIRVPPCSAPPTVRSSSRMVSSATTRSGPASTLRNPRRLRRVPCMWSWKGLGSIAMDVPPRAASPGYPGPSGVAVQLPRR